MAFAHPMDSAAAPAEGALETAVRPFVSIVMPCLNEEQTVEICVRKALGWLERSGTPGEVVVVDNGSTDRSAELAAAAGARVVHESVRGYGAALRRGFAEARGEWLVMGDCDDTYDFSDLDALMRAARRRLRHVGRQPPRRRHRARRDDLEPPLHRHAGHLVPAARCSPASRSATASAACAPSRATPSTASTCKTDGMELASEMILKAARRGLKVADVPVPYGERLGEAKLNTVRDGWRHLRFLLLASPNYLFTIPGIMLTVLGIADAAGRAARTTASRSATGPGSRSSPAASSSSSASTRCCSASRRGSIRRRAASRTKTARCASTTAISASRCSSPSAWRSSCSAWPSTS